MCLDVCLCGHAADKHPHHSLVLCRVVFGEKCTQATGRFVARVGSTLIHLPQMFKRCLCGAVWKLTIMAFISLTIIILVILWREGVLH